MLDLYWHKTQRHKFKDNKYLRYDALRNSDTLPFQEWFNLYQNLDNKIPVNEDLLEHPPHTKIN